MSSPQATTTRNYAQSMGYWLNEPSILEPAIVEKAMHELADAGFGIVRIMVRNTNYTHRSPEVVRAVGCAVAAAHARGIKVALDCEPHSCPVGRDMGAEFPHDMGAKLVRAVTQVVDGHYLFHVDTPGLSGGTPILEGIEAAYLRNADGFHRIDLPYQMRRETAGYRHGFIHREEYYVEHVKREGRPMVHLHGRLEGVKSGELVAYLRFANRNLVDFWSEGFRSYYESLLECYRDIPLDGIGWDEPAVDMDWTAYRYGTAFAKAFKRLNGYALADRLHLLDDPGMSPEAVRVRLDYYRTLNEGVAQAQANLIGKARALFGNDLLLGTHHTWQGEGGINDYRTGAVDYFRLNDSMDAGYTDCCWWDPQSVAYAYVLASSLGRLTPSGEAEVNTWHYKPTVENTRVNANLMTLMNITWFNIWYGSDCDTVLYPSHYTWPEAASAMRRHQALQRTIGRRQPVVDVAIWHGWEGVCAWNETGVTNAHKAFCMNTSHLFIQRSIAADFIDSRLLAESQVMEGRLVNRLGRYRVLIMPYALVLPRDAWDVCAAFAAAGGRVVFVGTPVSSDSEGGSLANDFAALLDCPAMSAEEYLAGVDAVCSLPDYRPQRIEVCRPLADELPRKLVSCEGEVHGIVNERGNVVFLTDLDPQQRLIQRIEDALSGEVSALGDNLLWRLYGTGADAVLAVAGRENRPIRGLVRWAGMELEITGGSVGLFCLNNGSLKVLGDIELK